MKEHDRVLDEEAKTWCIEDPVLRAEKIQREVIRYPKLIRDLLLDRLNTAVMDIIDVGGGPVSLISLLPAKSRVVLDPLTDEYKKFFSCPDHIRGLGENILLDDNSFDLAVCTNALDHVDKPKEVLEEMVRLLRPGGFLALMCAENNALTNPHPAHRHNLTIDHIHQWVDDRFETVWDLTYRQHGYRYGWVPFEGRVGQPAWAVLMRKTVGYGNIQAKTDSG